MPDSKLTISNEEARRVRFAQRKAKAMKHLQLTLRHIKAMIEMEKGS